MRHPSVYRPSTSCTPEQRAVGQPLAQGRGSCGRVAADVEDGVPEQPYTDSSGTPLSRQSWAGWGPRTGLNGPPPGRPGAAGVGGEGSTNVAAVGVAGASPRQSLPLRQRPPVLC